MPYKDPEKRKEHHREYVQSHQEKIKANQKRWHQDHKEQCLQSARKYRQEHQEEIKQKSLEYYRIHREQCLETSRKCRQAHLEERKQKQREYYQTHREKIIKSNVKYHQAHKELYREIGKRLALQLKIEVFSHYSNGIPKCAHCGINDIDVLCLDHINGGGAKQRRELGGRNFHIYRWLRKNNYPTGYQVLCANCNLKKRIMEGL